MLLKPRLSMYREGLALMRTRMFRNSDGFNFTGRPKVALNETVSMHRARQVKVAMGYWKNTCASMATCCCQAIEKHHMHSHAHPPDMPT